MLAVILAGGLGTRLRPLTLTRPKPLLPILDKPMIEYLLATLPKDVDKVLMTVSYKGDALKAYFESRPRSAYDVTVINETTPLGTGGAIKNVEKHIDGTFLVFNGDVISSLDVHRMLQYHNRKRGIGTISLWRVEDVSRYGVVEMDEQMRIHQFREKVPKERAQSDMINAGAYALEPDILEYMDPGKVTSIEREVFPLVIKRGLYGYHFEGHWVDAGTPASFLEAQGHVLKTRGTTIASDLDDVKLIEPIHISKGCHVGKGSTLGPNVFLGNGVVLGKGCVVHNSSIDEGSEIGEGATVSGAIIGIGAKVPSSTKIYRKVIGDKEQFKA